MQSFSIETLHSLNVADFYRMTLAFMCVVVCLCVRSLDLVEVLHGIFAKSEKANAIKERTVLGECFETLAYS